MTKETHGNGNGSDQKLDLTLRILRDLRAKFAVFGKDLAATKKELAEFRGDMHRELEKTNDRIDSVERRLSERIDNVERSLGERIDVLGRAVRGNYRVLSKRMRVVESRLGVRSA